MASLTVSSCSTRAVASVPRPAGVARQPLTAALQQQMAARRSVQRTQRMCHAAAAPEEAAPPAELEEAQKPNLMSPAWQQVVDWQKENKTIKAVVKAANKSGLQLQVGRLNGFLPYKLINPTRVPRRQADGSLAPVPAQGYAELIGESLEVKITQVIVPEKRLIVSEKAVLLEQLAGQVEAGDIVEGVVGGIMDWGAFIECTTVNGQPCPRAEAVLPMREISYAWVASVQEVLSPGEAVRVAVVYVQSEPAPKVVVSLKRLEDDPLKETLDKVLPLNECLRRTRASVALDKVLPLNEGGETLSLDAVPASVPSGMEEILESLSAQPGVKSVTLGRTVEEKRTVSQDLELWITKEVVEHGYNLAVRAGRVVQEVRVATDMSAEEMRATLQRVLRAIN
ncbi:30S ribosomal S1 [Micractinium conductrix]|uniref:30S ribosomal S1 n=1 Tax=Micractinium conductrix TaxID=554055 RepID=A0A2P6V9W4_9CHLO|nr:30S ribosomal S1 [Micractinium conductrix]|eukprot:PSC70883.1 30S ribosomal S1 [Micractinium conductrix]